MRRLVRRRNDGHRSARAPRRRLNAVTSVRRGRALLAAGRSRRRLGRRARGRAGLPGRRGRGASSSSALGDLRCGRAPPDSRLRLGFVSSPPNRFLASSSALRLVSSSCRRRSSSSRLRASAASRSVRSIASRVSRIGASLLGDLALFGLAQAGVGERVRARAAALRRSASRSTTPGRLGAARRRPAAGGRSGAPERWPWTRARCCRRRAAAGSAFGLAGGARGASPSRPPPPWCGRG